GLESYYESFGHPWERLAWIKARPVAGDLEQGDALIKRLAPFVYRKHLDFGFADEVASMKRRIDARGARLGRRDGFNVKLGRGGIREVEFAVQTLQLMWGGKLPELRAVDTKTALSRLVLAGLLEAGEADGLLGAYSFLRRIEHALQLRDDRQTHTLPGEPTARRRVAELLGFGAGDAGLTQFEQVLGEQRRTVREAFESIVDGVERPSTNEQWEQAYLVALDPDAATDEREAALAELGFGVPAIVLRTVQALMRRPDSPFHPRAMAAGGALATKILAAVTATADPDAALSHTERLLRTLRHRKSALDQLEADPRRLRTLVSLFGTSHLLSRLLVRSPGLLDRLVFDGTAPALRTAEELTQQLASEPGASGDWEALLGAVRRFHQAEILRIGFFDLAGLLDTASVGRQLSDLADVIVRWLVESASAGIAGLGVIGLGKLAGRSLGYGSDLDLVFVHDGTQPGHQMTRIARRVMTGLSCATPEGTLYDIDTRLRPSGNQGPLCVTRERLLAYHRDEADTWEKQAILRSRAICGDGLDDLVGALRGGALGAFAADAATASHDVQRMLLRLRETRNKADLKLGQGGLVELEFLVQFLQLTLDGAAELGLEHPATQPGTQTALMGLADVGAVSSAIALASDAAYGFLRQLENRLFLVQDRPMGALTLLAAEGTPSAQATATLRRLALRMGYSEGVAEQAATALRADYGRHRDTIATAYREVFALHTAPST
ncbi:MAG: glutamate-ammonia-ligase adenylyltransferase, partial [Myxococcota bacterium]